MVNWKNQSEKMVQWIYDYIHQEIKKKKSTKIENTIPIIAITSSCWSSSSINKTTPTFHSIKKNFLLHPCIAKCALLMLHLKLLSFKFMIFISQEHKHEI